VEEEEEERGGAGGTHPSSTVSRKTSCSVKRDLLNLISLRGGAGVTDPSSTSTVSKETYYGHAKVPATLRVQ